MMHAVSNTPDWVRRLSMDVEANNRRARRERLLREARIPKRFKACTLETYPVSDRTRSALNAVTVWFEGPPEADGNDALTKWQRERKQSLLLHGPFGTGKTGLAVGLIYRQLELEEEALFFTVPTLLDHIRRTYAPNSQVDERDILEEVKTTPFLVLDDLGVERVTEWVAERLFTIINHRHDEDLPTVFTSNLDIAQLGDHIGERTTWRIVEMAEIVKLDGPNLRDRRGSVTRA